MRLGVGTVVLVPQMRENHPQTFQKALALSLLLRPNSKGVRRPGEAIPQTSGFGKPYRGIFDKISKESYP
jgi:hypothetical protein